VSRTRPPPALLEEREEIDAALDEQATDIEADLLAELEDNGDDPWELW
jgi:hypothetical protein